MSDNAQKPDPQADKELNAVRNQIDRLDEDMLEALGERMKLVKKIGPLKERLGKSVEDPEREKSVRGAWQRIAGRKDLSWSFVSEILEKVFKEAKRIEG